MAGCFLCRESQPSHVKAARPQICPNVEKLYRRKATQPKTIGFGLCSLTQVNNYILIYLAWAMATASATVAPTIGLLPIPIKPIIST